METNQVFSAEAISRAIDQVKLLKYDLPKERFVTYEASDLDWMVYFGLAKERPVFGAACVSMKTFESVRESIATGYPAYGASTLGFESIPIVVNDMIPEGSMVLVNESMMTRMDPVDAAALGAVSWLQGAETTKKFLSGGFS